MTNPELPYIVGWSCILEIGPVKFQQLMSAFGSARAAWQAGDSQFPQFGWGPETIEKILAERKKIEPLKEFEKCQKQAVVLLTTNDPGYPKLLKEIHDPPFLLYVRGEIKPQDGVALTVVGSRRMSVYGAQVVEAIVPELVNAGLTIVSGLAFGVDYKATAVAFESGGRTITVLGSGVDFPTPVANAPLAQKILAAQRGAVISEFPLGVTPQPFYFPRRDRLLSGLSLGTLVVEAAEKSGSLITPQSALEQGREVFAVPGSIFSLFSRGTHGLIKQGAKMVTAAGDILEELEIQSQVLKVEAAVSLPDDPGAAAIFRILETGQEVYVDEIIRQSGLPPGLAGGALTVLELKGMVKNIGNGYYRKT